MSKRTNSPKKAQKKVGFAIQGTSIEAQGDAPGSAAEAASPTRQRGQSRQATLDIYVAKAKEFESFKQMPRFSHALGAVIHPSPTKVEKEPRHRPPKSLQFDGSPLKLAARPAQRQLPEELVRPPIDEEKRLKLKE